jgi:ABC-type polar amino acid transport system ATPase subunit
MTVAEHVVPQTIDRSTEYRQELAVLSLFKQIGATEILKNLSLEVFKGEAVAIIGPSGSGKSTLLRCLTLLERPSAGEIFFKGKRIARGPEVNTDENVYRQQVGLVFQEFNLWNNMSVLDNVIEAPLHVLRKTVREARELGREWLCRVGLKGHETKYPTELSGGQRQRAALARAFAMNPEVLLLDEITSALDVQSTARLLALIEELRTPEKTFLFVTHHLGFAERHMERLAVLVEGHIVEYGPPSQVLHDPQVEETKLFLKTVKESW